ncbi:MAG TPA: cyclic nucleotide-binding domain-containing protein [Actinomycetes bacterium]|jgi:CRP-like cAMP-binding protein|nr:cyclic nucleotide-binding domain-containing protein [Actinomycetes bacterium]
MDQPTAADLGRIPLLSDLTDDARHALAAVMETEIADPGHAVVTEGRPGYAFYVIASGTADVVHDGQPLRQLGPGDFFGEIAIMGEGRRTATVIATAPLITWVLFGASFRGLESDRPEVAAALHEAMRERLANG